MGDLYHVPLMTRQVLYINELELKNHPLFAFHLQNSGNQVNKLLIIIFCVLLRGGDGRFQNTRKKSFRHDVSKLTMNCKEVDCKR